MNQVRDHGFDRIVSRVLLIGAFAGFAIMLTGLLARVFGETPLADHLEYAGVLVMLVTPVVRVFVAMVLFLREKDWKYTIVSFGVMLILLLGSVFGIGEH
jgi:uncharacterized membrane protein